MDDNAVLTVTKSDIRHFIVGTNNKMYNVNELLEEIDELQLKNSIFKSENGVATLVTSALDQEIADNGLEDTILSYDITRFYSLYKDYEYPNKAMLFLAKQIAKICMERGLSYDPSVDKVISVSGRVKYLIQEV